MTISVRAVSNIAGQALGSVAASTVSITPTLPTGTTTGDRVLIFQTHSCTGIQPSPPTGWRTIGPQDQAFGSGTTASGTGTRFGTWYFRDKDATWSTMPALALASQANNSHWVGAITITPTSGSTFAAPTLTSPSGSFNTATTAYTNHPSFGFPNTFTGGLWLLGTGLNDNVTSTTSTITQTGTTFGTLTERCDGGTATGFSVAGKIHTAPVTTGSTAGNQLTCNLTLSAASQGETLFIQQTEFVSSGAMSTLTDDFNTGSTPDAAKWAGLYGNATGTLSGGQLVQSSSNNMGSINRYSLIGSSAFIQAFSCTGAFQIWTGPDGSNGLNAWNFSTAGFAGVNVENAGVSSSVAHTSGNCYRIRESSGNLLFDYSTDGVTWTNLVTQAWTWSPQVVLARFGDGNNTWDNLNTVPPPPSNTNLFFDMF